MIKADCWKEKDIDQLIEEELENGHLRAGSDEYNEYRLRVEAYLRRVEASHRKGMPGLPKWSEPVKCVPSRSENTLGDFAGAVMNLLVIVLISTVVVLVIIQAIWEVW